MSTHLQARYLARLHYIETAMVNYRLKFTSHKETASALEKAQKHLQNIITKAQRENIDLSSCPPLPTLDELTARLNQIRDNPYLGSSKFFITVTDYGSYRIMLHASADSIDQAHKLASFYRSIYPYHRIHITDSTFHIQE